MNSLQAVFFCTDVPFASWWKWPLFFFIVQLALFLFLTRSSLVEQVLRHVKNDFFIWAWLELVKEDCVVELDYNYKWIPVCFSGVADGVGGWRDYGVDPSQFSGTLMKTCERLVKEGRFVPSNPVGVLTTSYYELLQNKVPLLGE